MWFAQQAPLSSGTGGQYAIGRFDLAARARLFHTHAGTDGIAVSGAGTAFATERLAGRVAIVGPSGKVREVSTPTPESHPGSIAVGPDGNGWFVEGNANRIGRVTPAGVITEFPVPPVLDPDTNEPDDANPSEIAAGPDGRLWFGISNGIATITTDGAIVEHGWGFPAYPMSIAFARDGSAWTSELEQRQLEHVAADGSATAIPFAADDPALLASADGTLSAFDSAGPYRWRLAPGGQPQRQTMKVTESRGRPTTIRAEGLQPVAAGPAGTLWVVANVVLPNGGQVDAIAVLDDSGRCIVPRLRGDSLAEAKLVLRNHSCRLGKVRRHNPHGLPARDLGIGRQSAPAGRVMAHDAAVAVTLTD
jgi:streptogramin lyase